MSGPMSRPPHRKRFAVGRRVITREDGAGVVVGDFVAHPDFEFGGCVVLLDRGGRKAFRTDQLAPEPPNPAQTSIDAEGGTA